MRLTALLSLLLLLYMIVPGAAAQDEEPELVENPAIVNSVQIIVMESFPIQASVMVKGELPDGCTELYRWAQFVEDNTIRITLTTSRDPEAMCTMALEPYEANLRMTINGLAPGDYTVMVNDVPAEGTLTLDESTGFPEDESLVPAPIPETCPEPEDDTTAAYYSLAGSYCFLYPEGYEVSEDGGTVTISAAEGTPRRFPLIINHRPAEGQTLEQVTQAVQESFSNVKVRFDESTVGTEKAMVTDSIPGIRASRVDYVVWKDTVFTLDTAPMENDPLMDMVRESFTFIAAEVNPPSENPDEPVSNTNG